MRLQISACGVTLALLLAGCLGQTLDQVRGVGWRISDSAFDGLENGALVHRTDAGAFKTDFEGSSPYGHSGNYASAIEADRTFVLLFQAERGPEVEVELRDGEATWSTFTCRGGEGTRAVDEALAAGEVRGEEGSCVFELTTKRALEPVNGLRLVWDATTIGDPPGGEGPGGGAPLRFEARLR